MKPTSELAAGTPLAVRLSLRDALELCKPRLSLMVLLTTAVGFLMAPSAEFNLSALLHVIFGTALAAGGASALNQYMERDADARMRRTARRPLPDGRVSPRDALLFGAACCLAGVAYLLLAVNLLTGLLCFLTIASYLLAYTPLKRRSPICTLVGAVPGALPIMMGWTAQTGRVDATAWILFAILFIWQLPHFLAIAVIYADEYAAAGFPMRAVVDRRRASPDGAALPRQNWTGPQAVAWCLILLGVTVLPALSGAAHPLYAGGAIVLGAAYLLAAAALARYRTRESARLLFLTSLCYLPALLTWLAIHKAPGA
ncbi:MAG: Protoheme IX farnesyltransferase [Phycisphaerae bacterium]|nr:Protoheme IX farnesyltransferase [Phycisphaerae bacterium]